MCAGVRAVGDAFAEELRAIGFRTRWVELPAGMKRAGHLVAETGGTRGKRLLLLGHLDTVLAGEKFRREGVRAFGTGAADMKGGDRRDDAGAESAARRGRARRAGASRSC